MELNADFDKRAVVHGGQVAWQDSPIKGVSRRMLDRIGDEVARATTIVRYDPGSRFSPHTHDGGEEFLVLDGVFQDEHGDYPVGTYVRNPPQSRHTPGSEPGCVILVKLWQFDPDDRTPVRMETDGLEAIAVPDRDGVSVRPLFEDARETVRLESWAPGARVPLSAEGGLELFVLSGGFEQSGECFSGMSWLRLPVGAASVAVAGSEGAQLWVKSGHLRFVEAPKF